MKNIIFIFISFVIIISVHAQTPKEYKPKKRVITSITNNKIRKTIITSTPTIKNKQVAVITNIKKDGVTTKSFLTYKKKRFVQWKTRKKNVYMPLVK
jgi:aspartate carbamoyltransferase catalytic subunit